MPNAKAEFIYQTLDRCYPDAHCRLHFQSAFQLTCAVMLSAQTTDEAVNRVTPELFARYPDAAALAAADPRDVEGIIRSIGLYRNKAANLIAMAGRLVSDHQGQVPSDMAALTALPGIGRKSADVIRSEWFHIPAIAVDTHVHRVSRRLGISGPDDTVAQTEEKLMETFPQEQWSRLHHLLIAFGRDRCTSRKPRCGDCPLASVCRSKGPLP